MIPERNNEAADEEPVMPAGEVEDREPSDAKERPASPKKSDKQKILEAENDRLKQDFEDHKAFSTRLQADFENYKKRNKTIATDMYNEGIYDTLSAILPVLDTFDYAVQNATGKEKEGVELIQKQFKQVLDKFALEELGAPGEEFNPIYHNAVMQVEDKDNAGKIVLVLQKGYKLGDKVLRYALVQVGC